MTKDSSLAVDFREALRPLQRRLITARVLSPGKTGILIRLAQHGSATASELAVAERVSAQAATVAVHELEGGGFVVRTPDASDRRRMLVEITEAGRDALRRERAAGIRWIEEAIARTLDADDRAALRAAIPVLHKLAAEPVDG